MLGWGCATDYPSGSGASGAVKIGAAQCGLRLRGVQSGGLARGDAHVNDPDEMRQVAPQAAPGPARGLVEQFGTRQGLLDLVTAAQEQGSIGPGEPRLLALTAWSTQHCVQLVP